MIIKISVTICVICGLEFQILRRVAFLGLGDLGGCAGREDLSALAAALRTHVDDPISLTDHVKVVLNDDGGIDIVAYVDPLGAQIPRIKVQVKHKPDTAIPASDVRALLGILKAGDIALFVTSGTYSADAKQAASGGNNFIRLIDGDEFIQMWQEYYDKMSDDDKNMLPLKRISFLGNNE